ncbi:MAG: hypothetical protein IT165_02295 [Bryobacterales bacterium]|nr:hypothetical protein [Bryobacterales bacterium]
MVLYRTEDGQTRLQVRLVRDSAWLNLNQIADLFQRDKSVISKHIKNIFDEGEIDPAGTVAKFATVQTEGALHGHVADQLIHESLPASPAFFRSGALDAVDQFHDGHHG